MLFDLHNDFPTRLLYAEYNKYISAAEGLTVTAAIWTSEFNRDAEAKVIDITQRIKSAPIAIEDIGFLGSGEKYKSFDFSPYFYCSLTWNFNNAFAGGALDDGQLTENGKRAIRIINDSGCVVDLAHLNKKSFYQALDCAKYVMCSHTGFNGHLRSLDDGQIRELLARNAIIGLCTVRAFTDAYSAEQFADVLDGFVQKYGCNGLALGTDFNGSDDVPDDINGYDKLIKVKDLLLSRGYTNDAVNKIFFENANTFYKKER